MVASGNLLTLLSQKVEYSDSDLFPVDPRMSRMKHRLTRGEISFWKVPDWLAGVKHKTVHCCEALWI